MALPRVCPVVLVKPPPLEFTHRGKVECTQKADPRLEDLASCPDAGIVRKIGFQQREPIRICRPLVRIAAGNDLRFYYNPTLTSLLEQRGDCFGSLGSCADTCLQPTGARAIQGGARVRHHGITHRRRCPTHP